MQVGKSSTKLFLLSLSGWFYHAPAPAASRSDEPAPAPAPSQIPGLSDLPYEEEQPRLTNLRDTDTKYIRLAKQGGRPGMNLEILGSNKSLSVSRNDCCLPQYWCNIVEVA